VASCFVRQRPAVDSGPGGRATTTTNGNPIGGWKRGALVAVPAGIFAAGLGLGKIVRDCSLTCNVGYRYAPLAILAVALAVVPLASVAIRSERRWGYRRWQLSSLAVAAASLLGFRLLTFWLVRGQEAALAAGRPEAAWIEALRWAYLAFYVCVGALATLLSANVLSSVQRVFPSDERERGVAALPLGCHRPPGRARAVARALSSSSRVKQPENLSWNCGAEGPSERLELVALRRRQQRNFLTLLFLSQAGPMLQAGAVPCRGRHETAPYRRVMAGSPRRW